MVKKITKQNFHQMCKDIKYYVEKNYDLPTYLEYDNTKYYQIEMAYALAYGLFHLKQDITIPNFNKWSNLKGEKIHTNVYLNEIQEQCKRVYNHIFNKGEAPSSVLVKADKNYLVSTKLWIYCIAKTIVYYDTNLQMPNYTHYNSDAFIRPDPVKSYSEKIFDLFCKYFGKPTSIDDALRRIRNCGYGFYYDDRYSNEETIIRLAKGLGVNCTDVAQMMWHIGKVLGYDVRAVHVWCTVSNVGHVRLDFKHPQNTDGQWVHRDAAAVIDGECVECIWCSGGELLSYDPNWFVSNLFR